MQGRDRLLDQRLLVLGVGVPHPQVLPALLLNAGDAADREVRGVGVGGEPDGCKVSLTTPP